MLGTANLDSRPFAGGTDFLDSLGELKPGFVLLDIRMPQMDGFQVMAELTGRGIDWPVVVMTGHGEVSIAVRAMKAGALDFLEKPFSQEMLLGCISKAFAILSTREEGEQRRREARARTEALTPREGEVLRGLLAGRSNKTLAHDLGISLRTVEMHRGNMMDRLKVENLAEALAMALQAGLEPGRARPE